MEFQDESGWRSAVKFLPLDLDGLARQTGLLVRCRGVRSAEDLTRLLLMCAVPKVSLRAVADWANQCGVSTMGWTGLFQRLRDSEPFLMACFQESLRHGVGSGRYTFAGLDLVAVDATRLCGPKPDGADQILHTVYDLGSGMPRSVELTNRHGGERMSRHSSFGKGDLVLADRGYGYAKDILPALATGARLLIRFEFKCIRLLDALTGKVVSPASANGCLSGLEGADLGVRLPSCDTPLRAIGCWNKEGKPFWLLTDLSEQELPAHQARELYRSRWQVELFFKRLKSLLDLDELPTRDGPTARPWVWGKLILAALACLMGNERFSPWEQGKISLAQVPQGAAPHRLCLTRPPTKKEKGRTPKRKTKSYPTLLLEA